MNSSIVGLFVFVVCIGLSYSQTTGWNPSTVELTEGGGEKLVSFRWVKWPFGLFKVSCTVHAGHVHHTVLKRTIPTTPFKKFKEFVLNPFKKTYAFRLRALKDKKCKDQLYKVVTRCTPFKKPTQTFVLTIKVKNVEHGSACEDPHLTQKVNGVDEDGEAVTKKICYDLFGKSGDQTELITDKILGTSIVFELRDDYYIGKTFYSTKLGSFNITTTQMSWPKTVSSDGNTWGIEQEFVVGEIDSYPHAIVKQEKDDILIEYNEEKRSQSIRIAKIQQKIGKSFLNVLIEKSTSVNGVFDQFHGGLFGYISNQEYEFYDPVQMSSSPNKADLTVVKVNGRFVKAFLTGEPSETDRCYSMRLDDLLYPKNVYSFQKSL